MSIHEQTHKEIELIVVDDASTDSTYDRVAALLSSGFRKRFVNSIVTRNERNLGAHATINRAIALSNGTYISVINSDDTYHPLRISRLVETLRIEQSDVGFTLVDIMSEERGDAKIPPDFRLFCLRQSIALSRDPSIGFALLRGNQAVSTGNMIFTRSLFDKVGPFLPLKYCHDWDFILQSLYYCEPAVVLEPLYNYRLHDSNSFSSLSHLAGVESEVVLRRFFRRGLAGVPPNKLFPSKDNWPGLFELFIEECELRAYFDIENGGGAPRWRIYNKERSEV